MASKRRSDRLWRHALSDDADVRRAYPIEALERVEELIEAGEVTHTGEVCVAIEPALPVGRVWDTEDNNGVLIYLLLADRRFEVVADRGIHRRVGNEGWEAIARQMEAIFAERRYIDAVEHGVRAITALLAQHFPGDARDPNQLPNRPVLLT